MTQTFTPVVTGVVLTVPEAYDVTPYAHITLLSPFGRDGHPTSAELADVERFCAELTPFDFTLDHPSTFPDGTRYLCPEPVVTFGRLTHGLHRLFPEYPPYGGTFDLVVPHLTIPEDADLHAIRLPIVARAGEAALLHQAADGELTIRARFPFGTTAA